MKTNIYNPSPLEVAFANSIKALKNEIQSRIPSQKILEVHENLNEDNPCVVFKLQDEEGDRHEMVIKIIQRLDE